MKHAVAPLSLAVLLFAGLTQATEVPHASKAPHDPASHAEHAPTADHDSQTQPAFPAVRWQADEPLVRGMQRVRVATQALSHAAHGHLVSDQIKAVATELDSAVQAMFAECRLEQAPDAALHPLLARVLQSSARLAEGEFDAQALAELEAVLARYALLFDEVG